MFLGDLREGNGAGNNKNRPCGNILIQALQQSISIVGVGLQQQANEIMTQLGNGAVAVGMVRTLRGFHSIAGLPPIFGPISKLVNFSFAWRIGTIFHIQSHIIMLNNPLTQIVTNS